MKDDLVRFGVAMERSLLEGLDALVEARGVTRSEVLRDLTRAEVARVQLARGVPAAGSLTLVYDHHVRELTERLTAAQHELGDQVRATLHVHLDHDNCLEVIVLRGRSDELQRVGDRLLATRGVKQGGLQLVADVHPNGEHHGSDSHVHAHSHARSTRTPKPKTANAKAKKTTPAKAVKR